MNISAVLITTSKGQIQDLKDEINALDWAEVHQMEEDGRMIITIEGETMEEDIERLKVIKGLPRVLSASMIQYYFEDEMGQMWESVHGDSNPVVPEYLRNDDLNQKAPGVYRAMKGLSDF